MLSLFLFPPNRVSVLVGKLAAENLDKVNKISDAEQAGRQQVEDARADLADIEAMNAETAKEEAEQEETVNIVKTKRFAMKPMDAEEACVQMELLGHNFFMFLNADTNEVNVVYNRKGNSYGLIEPEF